VHRRAVTAIALLWALVALGASWRPELRAAAQDPAPGAAAGAVQKPFRHREHVDRVWLGPLDEVFRDCRGCHRFGPDDAFSTPQATCNDCHAGGGNLTITAAKGFEQDLRGAATRTSAAFRHHTHGMLECRECHLPDAGFVEDHMPVRTGAGQCARCHEPSAGLAQRIGAFRWFRGLEDEALARAVGLAGAFTPPTDAGAYADRLVRVFAGPDGGLNTTPLPPGGNFDHADHIALGASPGLDCAVCHADVTQAGAEAVGTGRIPVAQCKDCHVRDAAGEPARESRDVRQSERPLWSLGAFAHRDHYGFLAPAAKKKDGVCSAQAYADVEQQSCRRCHQYAPAVPGISERDFPFDGQASRHRYQDCVVCHDGSAWSTGESAAAPLHDSTGGDGNGWQRCGDCHVLGEPDLATRRPSIEVRRWTERTFVFPAHTHPDITTKGVQQSGLEGRAALQDCTSCHRAKVPALATRLVEKVFRHDVHLPANPTQQSCLECHPSAGTSTNSAALGGADARTYTLAACAKCHWGGEVTERVVEGEAPATRAVVPFPHGPHVTQHGRGCVECHELKADGKDVATKPEATSCAQCHDHVAQETTGDSRYEGLFGHAGSCVKCHHEDVGGREVSSVPTPRNNARNATDRRYHATQSEFAGFADSQFHPLGQACAECHRAGRDAAGQLTAIVMPVPDDHLQTERQASVHDAVARGGFGQSSPHDCLRCHWKPCNNIATRAGLAAPVEGEPAELRRLRGQPSSREARARFGNLFDGYPGTERAKG
jgi:hypothetical protein